MNAALHAFATLPLAALLLAASPHAAADPFAIVDPSRTLDAFVFVPHTAASPPTLSSTDPGAWEAARHLGPYAWNSTESNATGEIAVAQQSFIGTSQLSFSASADAFASGSRTSPFAEYSVLASGTTTYGVSFDIATPTPVQLTLDSEIGGLGIFDGIFDFELSRDGTVVWTDELKRDPVTGAETRSFTQALLLQPGHYALSALVRAQAAVFPDVEQVQAHVLGEFMLAAVPEPRAWAVMLAGLVLVGAVRRCTVI
jgi:hypothetical protein